MLINLRLSKINLNDNSYEGGIVESICELVKNSDTLSYLDLSWTSLSPSQLILIVEAIIENHNPENIIRSLNLSYNTLFFSGHNNKLIDESIEFIELLKTKFLKQAKLLSHLDFSGMGFTEKILCDLSFGLVTCPLLAAVHFNDNGFYDDIEGKLAVMDVFGIDQASLNP